MPVISTNDAANTALRYLNINSENQSDTLSRLSSGSRITRASDDAAGLAVSTALDADVATLDQASTNASHGISILETADGGLSEISDILERMKSLSAQSLSGAVTDNERSYIESEYSALMSEVDSISTSTSFNGDSLLDGNADWSNGTGVSFLLGTDVTNDTLTVNIDNIDSTTLTNGTTALSATSVDTQTNASAAASVLDAAIDMVAAARAEVGAQMSQMEFRKSNVDQSGENLQEASSAIQDADVAEEQNNLSAQEVQADASIAALKSAQEMNEKLASLF